MNRITRLFGRKTEPDKELETQQPALSNADAEAGQTSADLGVQAFGLTFTLESGEVKLFTSLPITIGRSTQGTLSLEDQSVSAQHAYIYYDERLQRVCISDLDSTNGLFIDDQPTRKNVLQDEARIRLGNALLVFRDTGYIHSAS